MTVWLLHHNRIITDAQGQLAQTLDYYPFGGVRLDEKTGAFSEQKKFTGKDLDKDTGLYYYGARYYDGRVGRFTGVDPLFQDIGINKELFKQKYGKDLIIVLIDPQNLNSYSYVENNPMRYNDPDGKDGGVVSIPVLVAYGLRVLYGALIEARPVGDNNGPADSNAAQTAKIGVNIGTVEAAGKALGYIGGKILGKVAGYFAGEGATTFEKVAGYIEKTGKLPSNYITKGEAKNLGWRAGKDLSEFAPGKSLGGDVFYNNEKLLPEASGRIWKEADIGYTGGTRSTTANRIVYSNDGLIYKTTDHYKTFEKIK